MFGKRIFIERKTPDEIDAMRAAGELSAAVLRVVGAAAKPGVSTLELDELAEAYIRDHGGIPAFKGYGGFPGSICASINEQVVHGIPSADVVLKDGDILSIDTGATVDGWVGDNAWTFPIGTIDPQCKALLHTTEQSMWAGISAARPGNTVGDIGHAVQDVAEREGYGVVREYVGHGVGRMMHMPPDIPNYGRPGTGIPLYSGMVIAIEPMITMGPRKIVNGSDGWLVSTKDGKPAAHFEKTIAITEGDPIVLTAEPDHMTPAS